MEIGKPFIIESAEFENHSAVSENDAQDKLPFEFIRTRMWSENFCSPEISGEHSIAALEKELCDIKELVRDIRNILKETFEL